MKLFGLLWVVGMTVFGLACGRGEIRGRYEVELEIAGVPNLLNGVLILSTQALDIPSLSETDGSIDSNWFGGDAVAANSCFILEPNSSDRMNGGGNPGIVRVFEARIDPGGILMPLEILNASDLRTEIVKLQFFANAVGGELEVHTSQGIRPGRIHGVRTGSASAQECLEALDAFRSFLRELPTDEGPPQ